ncbi:MAG: DUF1844 domain-containing protein [Thermoanaerobaculia bacterium]
MSTEKKSPEPIKVTDKRIFTAEGDIRDEYRNNVTPVDPATVLEQDQPRPAPAESEKPAVETDKRFIMLLQLLDANVYNALELAGRGHPQGKEAARQMIDVTEVLGEKTMGNLSAEESDALKKLLGEAKMLYMKVTKGLKV